jgi:hypothetical protein
MESSVLAMARLTASAFTDRMTEPTHHTHEPDRVANAATAEGAGRPR